MFATQLSVPLAGGKEATAALVWKRDVGPVDGDGCFPEVVRLHSLCLADELAAQLARVDPLIAERMKRLQTHLLRPWPVTVRRASEDPRTGGPTVRLPRLFAAAPEAVRHMEYLHKSLRVTDGLMDSLGRGQGGAADVLDRFCIEMTEEERAIIRRAGTEFVLLQGICPSPCRGPRPSFPPRALGALDLGWAATSQRTP